MLFGFKSDKSKVGFEPYGSEFDADIDLISQSDWTGTGVARRVTVTKTVPADGILLALNISGQGNLIAKFGGDEGKKFFMKVSSTNPQGESQPLYYVKKGTKVYIEGYAPTASYTQDFHVWFYPYKPLS